MSSLPLFFDLKRGSVLVVGSTAQAHAKLAVLQSLGARVRWYPLAPLADVVVPQGRGEIEISAGEPRDGDLKKSLAVILASGGEADERIALAARQLSVPVNVVDRPAFSTFFFPAVVSRGDVVVAAGTTGTAPVLARRLREKIEALLPARLGALAEFLSRWRSRLKQAGADAATDRAFWETIIDGPVGEQVLNGDVAGAEASVEALIARGKDGARTGSVALVGAGPGDPDLLTVKALRALQNADIVFHDDLVSPQILDRARRDAVKVFAGKRKGAPGEGQDAITKRLIEAARKGHNVVRLKGGDPFIFGRGGEELEALRAAGVAVTIVPGITAALGCAAEAELPLTYRSEATKLLFVTAHNAAEASVNWQAAADKNTTLVIYMGLTAAAAVRDGLLAAGRSADTPAVVLARGTREDSAAVAGALSELPALAERAGEGPALLVIGETVAHSRAWRALARETLDAAA